MTKIEKLWAMYTDGLIERHEVPESCWRKPRKPKPLSLAIAIRKAKAKGMDLTVAPDGSMTFKNVVKVPEQNTNHQGGELDQWLAKRHAR